MEKASRSLLFERVQTWGICGFDSRHPILFCCHSAFDKNVSIFIFFFSFHQSTLQPYIYRPSLYSFTFLFCTARQLTASSIPRSPLFLDIIVFSNTAFVLTRFFFLIYFFIYFIAVLFLLLGSCRRKARVSLVIGSWTVDVLCAFLLSTIPVCIYICVD